MWKYFSGLLLRNKLAFFISIMIITIFMGYRALKVQLSYEFAKILPATDSTFIDYQEFKKKFGEDGNVMVMGFADTNLFQLEKFRDWHEVNKKIKNIQGIKEILSVPTLFRVVRNDSLHKFDFVPLISNPIQSQTEVDSLKKQVYDARFYEGIIYNKETGANLIAITFKKKDLDSERRISIVKEITAIGDTFALKHNINMHYSGMPYIRSALMHKVKKEMTLFCLLAVIVTAIILWLFFRSVVIVAFSLIVVLIGVVWSFAVMQMFDYHITMLSSLVAPLIMVIGLPNCIFLVNKFQAEFSAHGNKIKALTRTIETIGVTLFLANVTTAIGFGVLYFTQSSLLVEFGVVAAISVLLTYIITLILVPIILNQLPSPKPKHTKHQDGKRINKILDTIDHLVQHRRAAIYTVSAVLTLISFWGMTFIDMNGYVVDDLPEKDPIYHDLKFFESNFKGVLPFEISIDTKKPRGLLENNAKALYKIKRLEKVFEEYPQFSKPYFSCRKRRI